MSVVTSKDLTLSFTLGGNEYACPLQDPEWTRPWSGTGSTTQLACGDVLAEGADTPELGSITGNVAADPTDIGITKWLHDNLGQEATFTLVETLEVEGGNRTVTYSGTCRVLPITRTWRVGRYSFHNLNLEWVSETAAPVFADAA